MLLAISLSACQLNPLQDDPKATRHTLSNAVRPSHGDLEDEELPRWVRYPPHETGMAYGVGSAGVYQEDQARAIQAAKDGARIDLLKQLKTTVGSETRVETRRVIDAGKTQFTRDLRESIYSAAPETEVRGIEVVEVYLSHAQKTAYALARLDRDQAAAGLRRRIETIDAEFPRFFAVPADLPKTSQLKRLLPVLSLIGERDKLEEQLHLVSNQSGHETSSQAEALNRRIENLFDQLQIGLRPSGKDAKALESGLFSHLTKQGLTIGQSGNADLTLTYQLETRSKSSHGDHFVYAEGRVEVTNAAGDTINMVAARAKGVSGVSEAQARANAVQQLGDHLGEALRQSLLTR